MDKIKHQIVFALEKLPCDDRDYSHDATFGTLGAGQLPTKDFTIYDSFTYSIMWGDTLTKIAKKFGFSVADILNANPKIVDANKIRVGQNIIIPERKYKKLNQIDLDFCTAFTTTELQNALWGIPSDPFYQMAKIKQIRGEYKSYGANLRDAMKSVLKFGSLPLVRAPYTYDAKPEDKTRDFLANWQNYPTALDNVAMVQKDASFFVVDGTGDVFDNMRSTMWIHRQERRGISLGLFWHNAWTYVKDGIIPDDMPNDADGGGHNMAIVGQKTINGKLYLVAQQTWGDNAGDNGFYYFPRSIINAIYHEGYGVYTVSNSDKTGITLSTGLMTLVATFINKLIGNI